MGLGKFQELDNTVGFTPIKFHIQILNICARVDLVLEGIGQSIFGAGWTYKVVKISTAQSTYPMATKVKQGHTLIPECLGEMSGNLIIK